MQRTREKGDKLRMGRMVQTERESDEAVAGAAVLCVSCFCQELIELAYWPCKGGGGLQSLGVHTRDGGHCVDYDEGRSRSSGSARAPVEMVCGNVPSPPIRTLSLSRGV